ncbi:MAG TPA: putative 2OG-Fe(II) oxygenase [Candidatus Saccharimonadales bacterium]|nr:putative 2OG-Fe(II) oxygenase [Candidatus Saccharimonadales bacterium]
MNRPNISIQQAFPSPLIQTVLPDCVTLNQRLRQLFLQWEQDKTRKRSSVPTPVIKVAVYESSFDLFSDPEPEIQTLRQFCLQTLGYVIAQLNGYSNNDMAGLRIYEHSWYHLTREGGYTAQHNHPMASWSGVYCVDPGDTVPDKPNNGALRFLEARTTASMYLDPGNAHLQSPYTFGELAFTLQPGQLVLFPSYLIHEVAPYYGRRERITVAFNAWVREAGAAVDVPSLKLR